GLSAQLTPSGNATMIDRHIAWYVNRISNLFVQLTEPTHFLHSFPTRRSSDLARDRARGAERRLCPGARRSVRGPEGGNGRGNRRSEEHTSELQSLRHLVCRLLLEKKQQHRRSCRFLEGRPGRSIRTCFNSPAS